MTFLTKYLTTLFYFTKLTIMVPFSSKNRMLLYRIHSLFYFFYNPLTEPKLPVIDIKELATHEDPLRIVEPTIIQGNVSPFELMVLSTLIQAHKPANIFEIGTFDGRTTLNLAINSQQGAHLYTIDLPKEKTAVAQLSVLQSDQRLIETNVTGSRFLTEHAQKIIGDRKITQLFGDTATFDFSPYFGKMDFVFIDAAHSYEYVKNDSAVALKLLRNGQGVILWHDYDIKHQGSMQAVEEIKKANPAWSMHHIKDTNIACLIRT